MEGKMTKFLKGLLGSAAFILPAQMSFAQVDTQDEVIVTGLRATAGGAQDIKYFRGGVESGNVPSPKGMTSEGLLSEHDLYLTSDTACAQLLCLNGATKIASLVSGDYFAGLGFDTNISDDWQREPLNLIAVIDRSGSMRGESIKNVRHSLREISDQLQQGDQITFILYGSDVVTHLEPLRITRSAKEIIHEKIDSIKVEGSTNMDAGLGRGYDIAFDTSKTFEGTSRVMIFTDERPNTGRTDTEGFMARAKRASLEGIGLTTIGYGVNYGSEMAAKIASVRGGNLFYVGDEDDVETLFDKDFDFMVSEIASDMTVTLKPTSGVAIKQVYGVPEHMISKSPDGSHILTVPSVFMSSNGGGLFLSLQGQSTQAGTPLFEAEMRYKEGPIQRTQRLQPELSTEPSVNLVKAEALSAQYSAMKSAAQAYYGGDTEKAFEIFNPFANTFKETDIEGLEDEYRLVAKLHETLAIETEQFDALETLPKHVRIRGKWKVTRAKNFIDVRTGDLFDFGKYEVEHFQKSKGFDEPYEREYYRVNEKQLYLTNSDLTFSYSFTKKGNLRLRHRDFQTEMYLKPVEDDKVLN
jgi:Ca-activated chloride channel family protein